MKKWRISLLIVIILMGLVPLLISSTPPTKAQSDWLQVWAQRGETENIAWIIEYRNAEGQILATYDLKPEPRLIPAYHSAGRLIGGHGIIVILDPYRTEPFYGFLARGGMETKGSVISAAIHPASERYAYTLFRMEETEDTPWRSWVYVATIGAEDDQLVLEMEHERSAALSILDWHDDGEKLLIHLWKSQMVYAPFRESQDVQILDVTTGETQPIGTIIGYADDFNRFVSFTRGEPKDDYDYFPDITGIEVLDLATGTTAEYLLPDLGEQPETVGCAVFSPDGTQIAYQAARWSLSEEKYWMIVVDLATGESRVVFTEESTVIRIESHADLRYGLIADWLDDSTLVVGGTYSSHSAVIDVTDGTMLREETSKFLGYAEGITGTEGFNPIPVDNYDQG